MPGPYGTGSSGISGPSSHQALKGTGVAAPVNLRLRRRSAGGVRDRTGSEPAVHAGYTRRRQGRECNGHQRSPPVPRKRRSARQLSHNQGPLQAAGPSSSLPTHAGMFLGGSPPFASAARPAPRRPRLVSPARPGPAPGTYEPPARRPLAVRAWWRHLAVGPLTALVTSRNRLSRFPARPSACQTEQRRRIPGRPPQPG
jgi:hypothetical protein